MIGLGTVNVREYFASRNCHVYGALVAIEKEGFSEILRTALKGVGHGHSGTQRCRAACNALDWLKPRIV